MSKPRRLDWIVGGIDVVASGLAHPSAHVLVILAQHADGAGECFPSIATLSSKTGIPRRSVERAIQKLRFSGLVQVTTGGQHRPNCYALDRSAIESLPVAQTRQAGGADPSQPRHGDVSRESNGTPDPPPTTSRPATHDIQTRQGGALMSQEGPKNDSGRERERASAPAPPPPFESTEPGTRDTGPLRLTPPDAPTGAKSKGLSRAKSKKTTDRRKPETPAPPADVATGVLASWLKRWGIPDPVTNRESERFLEHAREKDRRCRDWSAAWRRWLLKAQEFAQGDGTEDASPEKAERASELATGPVRPGADAISDPNEPPATAEQVASYRRELEGLAKASAARMRPILEPRAEGSST